MLSTLPQFLLWYKVYWIASRKFILQFVAAGAVQEKHLRSSRGKGHHAEDNRHHLNQRNWRLLIFFKKGMRKVISYHWYKLYFWSWCQGPILYNFSHQFGPVSVGPHVVRRWTVITKLFWNESSPNFSLIWNKFHLLCTGWHTKLKAGKRDVRRVWCRYTAHFTKSSLKLIVSPGNLIVGAVQSV